MLNKKQAQKLAPLVQGKEWELLREYLIDLRELTIQGVVTAQSESELLRAQGKLGLLEMLLKLKSSHEAVVRSQNRKEDDTFIYE
jgi:hypothetical protein